MWIELGCLAGIVMRLPLAVSRRLPVPVVGTGATVPQEGSHKPPSNTGSLIVCYTLFGFGYILPATYLPAMARQLVDDPQVFGLAWPLFGTAAALSTVVVSWTMKRINRLSVWAASHFLMAIGVLLPCVCLLYTSRCV